MSQSTAVLKIIYRNNPALLTEALYKISAMDADLKFDSLIGLKQRFEDRYRKVIELKGEDRWLFIGLAFKLIYPTAYKNDDKDLKFVGFGEKMSELLNMQPPNFSEEFKKARFNISKNCNDLKTLIDKVYSELGYELKCQQTLFDL